MKFVFLVGIWSCFFLLHKFFTRTSIIPAPIHARHSRFIICPTCNSTSPVQNGNSICPTCRTRL